MAFLANPKYASQLPRSRASAVVVSPGVSAAPCAVLRAGNPYVAFARAIRLLSPEERPAPGVHATAIVGEGAIVEEGAAVGPYVVIGAGAHISAGTTILAHTVIGANAVL